MSLDFTFKYTDDAGKWHCIDPYSVDEARQRLDVDLLKLFQDADGGSLDASCVLEKHLRAIFRAPETTVDPESGELIGGFSRINLIKIFLDFIIFGESLKKSTEDYLSSSVSTLEQMCPSTEKPSTDSGSTGE